ncbi:MAG: glycosyltransferase family 2 protein [Ruthenibacterium sp.]
MPKTKVSGCIVAYNGFDEVTNAVTSIVSHTQGVDLHLYVVDNASPDGTGARLAAAPLGQDVTVRCLAENVGFGSGHNTVLPLLDSKYHAVINPDITLDTDALSALCAWMDAHPDVVMATPRLLFPSGQEQYTAKRAPTFLALLSRQVPLSFLKGVETHYLMRDADLTQPQEIDFCTGCFFVLRTDVLRSMGGFDESYFMYVEDADITRRAKRYGRVMYVPETHVLHAWHRDANKKWKNFWMQIGSMLRYWRKWGFHLYKN